MERIPVRSSCMRSVGYDPDSHVLEIEFSEGAVYRYIGVPALVHVALLAAPSKGLYLDGHIKPRYRCLKA